MEKDAISKNALGGCKSLENKGHKNNVLKCWMLLETAYFLESSIKRSDLNRKQSLTFSHVGHEKLIILMFGRVHFPRTWNPKKPKKSSDQLCQHFSSKHLIEHFELFSSKFFGRRRKMAEEDRCKYTQTKTKRPKWIKVSEILMPGFEPGTFSFTDGNWSHAAD